MTVRELIAELNTMVADGIIDENARIRSAEDEDIFSVVESIDNNNEVVIYF